MRSSERTLAQLAVTSLEDSVRVGHNHDSGRSVHRVTLSSSDVAAIRSAEKAPADAFEARPDGLG